MWMFQKTDSNVFPDGKIMVVYVDRVDTEKHTGSMGFGRDAYCEGADTAIFHSIKDANRWMSEKRPKRIVGVFRVTENYSSKIIDKEIKVDGSIRLVKHVCEQC